ncbi:DNA-binding transcriptional activator of the SARP family [Amycolatopsis xylanica]|uniref:DNA-binding transcriptional activator of the SARP family n=1 Tax=Amycolatopsis xylanica TaxID=589385 RepID=A0A1H3HDT1_9PSEU|nr:AfsR/SARP family transcriptional regulator [Amycolatopsis xylanica]SDY13018.1 DNA-binding transcriptional activator of the SARP family [Amycolatopsis xylanica]
MEFGLLGAVQATVDGAALELGPRKQRFVLTVLLLEADRPVPARRLIDLLWPENPPATALNAIQVAVSRLRKVLAGVELRSEGDGYRLVVRPEQVDLGRFRALVAGAAAAAGDEERVALLREALALWRGPVAAGTIDDDTRARLCQGLEDARLAAVEERIEAEARLGVVSLDEVAGLVARYPLRDRLRGALMLAQYRAGLRAEALETYRRGRELSVRELGLEPSGALRQLEQMILRDEPVQQAVPRQLPADTADFTGRDAEFGGLLDGLPPIAVIAGKGGIGKTTLAVRLAHALASRFPDGQLFADLGGGARVADSSDVLVRFLRALGAASIEDDPSAQYRSLLAGRKVLVVLDNAASERQLRPLIPGSATCAVLVTSRRRLTGLPGAKLLELEVLSDGASHRLLRTLVGARIDREPESAAQLVRLCGGLPLALRIVGARLAAKPHWGLGKLAGRLFDERQRLNELRYGDLEVRASLNLSYQGLSAAARGLFARLGLLTVPDFPGWVAAALLDVCSAEAEEVLEELLDAQLVDVEGADRYRCHDLVRLMAAEIAAAELSTADASAAVERAWGGWLALAELADQRLPHGYFHRAHSRFTRWLPEPDLVAELLADPMGWLEAERHCLTAVVTEADGALSWELASCLVAFFELRAHHHDWRRTHDTAFEAARRAGDKRGQALALRGLAELHTNLDEYPESICCFEQASALFAELGDLAGEAVCDGGLGHIHRVSGRYAAARRHFERAAELAVELGHPRTEAYARHGIAVIDMELGDLAAAELSYRAALALSERDGFLRGEAQSSRGLGRLSMLIGRGDEAVRFTTRALSIARELADPYDEANAAHSLADIWLSGGDFAKADALLRSCLDIYAEHHEPFGLALALRTLGRLHRARGEYDRALAELDRSREIWVEMALPLWHGRTLLDIGRVHAARGDDHAAAGCWAQARELLAAIGSPDASEADGLLQGS